MNISKACNNYIVHSIMLFAILTCCGFLAMKLWPFDLTAAIIVSGCYMLIIDVASAYVFRWLATKHADMLPTFITGVSGFRFFTALIVMAVWFVMSDRTSMGQFIVVFGIFYLSSLIHHSIFFSRISNRL